MSAGETSPQRPSADFTWRTFVFVLWHVCSRIALTGLIMLAVGSVLGLIIRGA
jgi:membrane-associated PAP2 superfamily phosphatase